MNKFLSHLSAWAIAPPATLWSWYMERKIIRGHQKPNRELSSEETVFARNLGILQIEKIRIYHASNILLSKSKWLNAWMKKRNFISDPAGLSLRYGIFIHEDYSDHLEIIKHELVHTMQYEERGGIFNFMVQYFYECFYYGYYQAPMEIQARELSETSN